MRTINVILFTLFSFLIVCSGGIFFLVHYPTIDLEQQQLTAHAAPTIVLDDQGNELMRFQLDRREPVPLQRIPQHLINAFLATEDRAFFQHGGISWRGIIRSTLVNLRHGRVVQGASTITQQLVKLIFLSHERTMTRKIKEQLISLIIEFQSTKEQILQAYLNNIYCGAGIYGVQAAAQRFWNKQAQDLSLAECALLAGLVKSPNNYCPLLAKNRQTCLNRRNLVLNLMYTHNLITQQEYAQALETPLNIRSDNPHTFALHAREMIRQQVETLIGREQLYAGGLTIKTTFNRAIQQVAEEAFKKYTAPLRSKLPVDGACITLDAHTNAIKALIGGFNFTESPFNRATQAHRQMGSIFKPLVYAAALEQGKTFADLGLDEPITDIKDWNPRNVHRRFEGSMTLGRALATSNNIIAIRTLLETGVEPIIELAKKARLPGPFLPYPALALGCTDCTLIEAAATYGIFVNQGVYQEPYCIEWIKDRWGKKIWKHTAHPEQALPSALCGKLIPVLKMVPENLAARLQTSWFTDGQVESIGKTGTTNQSRTCWFMGATPSYITGVMLGCDDNRPLTGKVSSTRTAAPIWLAINQAIEHPTKKFTLDPHLKPLTVDARTGELVKENHPRAMTILV